MTKDSNTTSDNVKITGSKDINQGKVPDCCNESGTLSERFIGASVNFIGHGILRDPEMRKSGLEALKAGIATMMEHDEKPNITSRSSGVPKIRQK